MLIWPVDDEKDLFGVENAVPVDIVDQILSTPWLDLPWYRQEGQESWPRRRIDDRALSWCSDWDAYISGQFDQISRCLNISLRQYTGTAWWLDEPGFTCPIHTDGEMPGSLHLTWIGDAGLGTTFYHYKHAECVRYQFPLQANCGYILINQCDSTGYRKLRWHGMIRSVPCHTFRLTSYSWIIPE